MNQPPQNSPHNAALAAAHRRPAWRLPAGVAPGTWEYTRQDSIASGYQDFLAQTPLIGLDTRLTLRELPPPTADRTTRVVDLGCGDGRTLRSLWAAGYDVLGVDLSEPMLGRVVGGEHGEAFQNRLIRANLVELGCIADASVDHAVCLFSTIGMIRGRNFRQQFIRHVARMVRPGGTFILHVHNRNSAWRDRPSSRAWFESAWASLRQKNHEIGDRVYAYRGLADMFLHTYSLAELRQDLLRSGWRIDKIIPLAPNSDAELIRPNWLPGLRAGGFFSIAKRP
ncbi:MAG TPA: class I SAM-dependent methyltransferase [Planctomycetaceae bacterium]|nr:class I SAM-dependent methyltransferase [Planctomycetaceae bacterium]